MGPNGKERWRETTSPSTHTWIRLGLKLPKYKCSVIQHTTALPCLNQGLLVKMPDPLGVCQ